MPDGKDVVKKSFFDPPSVAIRCYYISSVHNQVLRF